MGCTNLCPNNSLDLKDVVIIYESAFQDAGGSYTFTSTLQAVGSCAFDYSAGLDDSAMGSDEWKWKYLMVGQNQGINCEEAWLNNDTNANWYELTDDKVSEYGFKEILLETKYGASYLRRSVE
jgi:hypothetical protein